MIKILRSFLNSRHQESGEFSSCNFGWTAQADQVNKTYQSASYEARIPGPKELLEMRGIEYLHGFKNQSYFSGKLM